MPSPDKLYRYNKVLRGVALERVLHGAQTVTADAVEVLRVDGTPVALDALAALLAEFDRRREHDWPTVSDRPKSDSWLAPRLHACLRLSRAQASDKGVWHWLAVALGSSYVEWRWGG